MIIPSEPIPEGFIYDEPEVIYLQPECAACHDNIDPDTGQMWCGDDHWSGTLCDNCGGPLLATKYMRMRE